MSGASLSMARWNGCAKYDSRERLFRTRYAFFTFCRIYWCATSVAVSSINRGAKDRYSISTITTVFRCIFWKSVASTIKRLQFFYFPAKNFCFVKRTIKRAAIGTIRNRIGIAEFCAGHGLRAIFSKSITSCQNDCGGDKAGYEIIVVHCMTSFIKIWWNKALDLVSLILQSVSTHNHILLQQKIFSRRIRNNMPYYFMSSESIVGCHCVKHDMHAAIPEGDASQQL